MERISRSGVWATRREPSQIPGSEPHSSRPSNGQSTEDVAHYLSGRGNFYTAPFTVNRFVLMSSKESVGGGPYLTEEVFPLYESGGSWDSVDLHDHPA